MSHCIALASAAILFIVGQTKKRVLSSGKKYFGWIWSDLIGFGWIGDAGAGVH
jgi:hypothetical protein